ncbi:hypothetical protein AVEN_61922-1 [Araneus ventricosus]|uniref:Transposase Tc1-like domain-containing protein n=1 Tax=Araneus ventricosus TaxID=182803 RepID=A0A4Y2CB44_ARAVE|nr:hypothetical protein AVEN_61922-1 [Araneus ventricosus]
MLQFASSDSSAESEIAKAESMIRRNHLHDEMRWRAVGMFQAGTRPSAVTRELNVHRGVIHRLWNHYQRDRNASRRRESERRRIAITADDHYLLQCARRRRTLKARQWRRSSLPLLEGPYPSKLCRADCMKEDCSQQRPVVCVPLSPEHVRARLHWAREHRSWTQAEWGHVLFTDESRFYIQNDSRRPMIWREPGHGIGHQTSSK